MLGWYRHCLEWGRKKAQEQNTIFVVLYTFTWFQDIFKQWIILVQVSEKNRSLENSLFIINSFFNLKFSVQRIIWPSQASEQECLLSEMIMLFYYYYYVLRQQLTYLLSLWCIYTAFMIQYLHCMMSLEGMMTTVSIYGTLKLLQINLYNWYHLFF